MCTPVTFPLLSRFISSPFTPKTTKMKLPKTLLSAVLIGIAMQTITSCTKEKTPDPKEKPKQEKQQPDGCPACGMG